MDWLHTAVDLFLHLDRHLLETLQQYHGWIYLLLFVIVFAETGFVVTPFLPGDSLLFAAGALSAVDDTHTLNLWLLLGLLAVAAIAGNTLNYFIGRSIGARAYQWNSRWFKREYLERTQQYFERHGGMAVLLSRFAPIVRTFAPFVAGIGRMAMGRFQLFNIGGGLGWVTLFLVGGYLFGNLPFVKHNFGLVTIGVVLVSLLPLLYAALKDRYDGRRNPPHA
ncbi:MAG: DedA family protein [Steroidobacteraceae bacterium]